MDWEAETEELLPQPRLRTSQRSPSEMSEGESQTWILISGSQQALLT